MNTLKQNFAAHLERELHLEHLYQGLQHSWNSQLNQLRSQIETLEARLSPWMTERDQPPRLAIAAQTEDAA